MKSIEVGGLMKLALYSDRPIEMLVADALIHLTLCRSENWKKTMQLKEEEGMGIEISLEELAMIGERVDFSTGALEDTEAINFWPHLLATMEFLETFDCYESHAVWWFVPEGLVGYMTWLLREGYSVADILAEGPVSRYSFP
jgi:hypothetical protein